MSNRRAELKLWMVGILSCAASWCAIGLLAPPNAAKGAPGAPAERKPGTAVRGQVVIPSGWSLSKPDLTRVVVYLASAPELNAEPPPGDPAIVAQHNKTFEPGFVVISSGATVEFPNFDNFDHNVFSRSPAAPAFDLGRYPKGNTKPLKFEKTGAIQLFCNIHPDMRAVIFVAPNPFYTRADREGRFTIRNVPPGNFEVVAWSERCEELRQPVKIEADKAPDITLTLREDRTRIMANEPPKKTSEYGIERGLSVKRDALNLRVIEGAHPVPATANSTSEPGR